MDVLGYTVSDVSWDPLVFWVSQHETTSLRWPSQGWSGSTFSPSSAFPLYGPLPPGWLMVWSCLLSSPYSLEAILLSAWCSCNNPGWVPWSYRVHGVSPVWSPPSHGESVSLLCLPDQLCDRHRYVPHTLALRQCCSSVLIYRSTRSSLGSPSSFWLRAFPPRWGVRWIGTAPVWLNSP